MTCIVIVEDEPEVLEAAESVLQGAGYDTRSAQTVAEAELLMHSADGFDLVFTDIILRNHTDGGLVIGRMVREKRPGSPVLYTSGNLDPVGPVEGGRFLPKPYSPEDSLAEIRNLLP